MYEKGSYGAPFTNAQRSALQSDVNLQLLFATHGSEHGHPDIGMYARHVTDADYANAAQLVSRLDPRRHDALAVEGYAYEDGKIGRDNLTEEMDLLAGSTQLFDVPDPLDYSGILEQMHTVRMINTFRYARHLALLDNIPVYIANANRAQMEDFQNKRRMTVLKKATHIVFGPSSILDREEIAYRDFHMVKRLGEIGLQVALQDPFMRIGQAERKPTLAFMAGAGHHAGVTRLLDQENVPYTATLFGGKEYPDAKSLFLANIPQDIRELWRTATGRSRKRELFRMAHERGKHATL
ncbi:MAG TPA: hypothetical protein VLE73_05890 [Candidatus Saccharimonadales bacterium]|nr:hypothetical protein [Candidatus Saccharimonadales bacterium]